MGILDFFSPNIKTISAGELRRILKESEEDKYTLVDVRQPGEYAEAHLPGAALIPLGAMAARAGELDKSKPVYTY